MRIICLLLLTVLAAFGAAEPQSNLRIQAQSQTFFPTNILKSNLVAGANITITYLSNGIASIAGVAGSGDAGGTNARQWGTINLTNWSNIPTGAMANIPAVEWLTNATVALTNQGNANSVAASNLSYAIGTAATNYANSRTNFVVATAGDFAITNQFTVGGIASVAPVLPYTLARYISSNTVPARLALETYSDANVNGSFLTGYRIRGTKASPGVVVSNDVLLGFAGSGWQGTMWTNSNAMIAMKAETNYTAQNQPSFIQFLTTARGSTSAVETLRINEGGTVNASNYSQTPFIPATDGTGSGEQRLAWRLGVLTNSVTITNTTANTSCITNALLGTQTIPANTLQPGSTVRVTLRGKMTSASATVTTFGFRSNNGLVLGTNVLALATSLVNDLLIMEGLLTIRSTGASGSGFFHGTVSYQATTGGTSSTTSRRLLNGVFATAITLDTTGAIVIDPYIDPGATTHGFTTEICTIEVLP